MVIMNNYFELYSWIRHSFKSEEFGIDRFRSIFPTSQAPKVIHDLIKQGYLKRVKRGRYKATEPNQLTKEKVKKAEEKRKALEEAEEKYAYCESTAVTIWTEGYYWTGFTSGFKPIHIKIREKDREYWKEFFKNKDIKYSFPNENKTLYGYVYILHPEKDFKTVEKEEGKVLPLKNIVKYCLKNKDTYQPALEYFNKHYKVDIKENTKEKTLLET